MNDISSVFESLSFFVSCHVDSVLLAEVRLKYTDYFAKLGMDVSGEPDDFFVREAMKALLVHLEVTNKIIERS